MTLNDPFGRNARRQERRYVQFRQQLTAQGCHSDEALDAFGKRVDSTAIAMVAIVAVACLLFWWLLPSAGAIALVLAVVILVWLASSYLQTRSLLNRLRLEQRQETLKTETSKAQHAPPPTEESL